jgi:predicted branched-subunit amino acid permease
MHHFRAPDARRFISASLMIGIAFVIFGASFGVLSVSAGASVAQSCAMSLLVFTGASQMSAVSVLASGGTIASAFGGAVLLSGRNAVYGLAMSPVLKEGSLASRLLGAQWVIDETTAIVSAETDPTTRRTAFWISGAILYASWNIGTLLGALVGTSINPSDFGLDAAFPCDVHGNDCSALTHICWSESCIVRCCGCSSSCAVYADWSTDTCVSTWHVVRD